MRLLRHSWMPANACFRGEVKRYGSLIWLSFVLLITTPLTAQLSGTVVDEEGRPIPGASISAFALETQRQLTDRRALAVSRTPLTQTTTNEDGRFAMAVSETVVDLSVMRDGFAPKMLRTTAGDEIGVLVLRSAASRSGRIIAGGAPVPHAHVIAVGNDNAEWIATTAEDGSYSIPDPDQWARSSMILHSDYAPSTISRGSPHDPPIPLDIVLSSGTLVKGRVIDASGAPAAGVAIRMDGRRVASSAEDGTFAVAHAVDVDIPILASSEGSLGLSTDKTRLIRLEPAATAGGTVTDDRGRQALDGVEVQLRDRQGGTRYSAISDALGHWRINSAVPGAYLLAAKRPGYAVVPTTVRLQSGSTMEIDIHAAALGRISGQIVDERDRPQSFVQVLIVEQRVPGNASGRIEGVCFTGPDGRYVLTDIVPGSSIRLAATKPGFERATSEGFSLAPGEHRTQRIVMQHGIMMTGHVHDTVERPISRASVRLTPRDDPTLQELWPQEVMTDARGEFSLRLPRGTYRARISAAGYATRQIEDLLIADGSAEIDVALKPAATLTGRVTRSLEGLAGVTVKALNNGGIRSTVTAGDGTFRLEGLEGGDTTISINKPDELIDETRHVVVPGEVRIDIDPGHEVSGTVTDASNRTPIRSFDVGVTSDSARPTPARHFESDSGTFVIPHVMRGNIRLAVTAEGYAETVSPIEVLDAPVDGVEVQLQQGTLLHGTVTTVAGEVVGGARIDVRADGPRSDFSATTDDEGHYAIGGLTPGEAFLTVDADDYLSAHETVRLEGASTRYDVALHAGGELVGQVLESGTPVEGAEVSATAQGMTTVRLTDPAGVFRFAVAAGHYRVTASKKGLAPSRPQELDVPSPSRLTIQMERGGVIAGRVVGMPTGAEVMVMASGRWSNAVAVVDATGVFWIEDVPSGLASVSARADLRGVQRSTRPVAIEVLPGGVVRVELIFNVR